MITPSQQALRNISVLIADADEFRREYIAQVLRDAGAEIEGLYAELTKNVPSTRGPNLGATFAYVGCTMATSSPQAMIAELHARGIVHIALCTHTRANFGPDTLILAAPIAAFQVVEALVELIARRAESQAPPAAAPP